MREESSSMNEAAIIGLSVGLAALCLIAVALLLYRRDSRRRERVTRMRRAYTKGYSDGPGISPAPPSLDHINTLEPWMKDQVNLRGYADRPLYDEDTNDNNSCVSSLAADEIHSNRGSYGRTSSVTFHETTRAVALIKAQDAIPNIGSDYNSGTDFSRTLVQL